MAPGRTPTPTTTGGSEAGTSTTGMSRFVSMRAVVQERYGGPEVAAGPGRAGARAGTRGVDNAGKLDFMRRLGADDVLDFRATDFTRTGPYDAILDLVAHRSVLSYRRALTPHGTYRCVGGSVPTLLRVLVGGAVVGAATSRKIRVLAVKQGPAHFTPLAERCATGEVDVHVAATFPLEQTAEALAMVGEGRALGKVVVVPGQAAG